ncbi:MAG: Gfo/Idh/MocA family oxidoreductase, partial [Clostridia bacterium]|nr:Gfo/Idh/MocA family oxidoreductase [Clostridia bacterium]
MRKIRIAQIGINRYSHGYDIFETLRALPEIFDIAGYALVEDEREACRDKLGIFDGFPELTLAEILADPAIEAVTVETDEVHLIKYARMAAEAGKHIHMEKPGSPDEDAFDALTRAMEASGKVFHLGYMYRYHPYIADAVERAASGALGDIFAVEAQMSRMDNETVRRWLAELPGGMMYYLGCHLLDIVLR